MNEPKPRHRRPGRGRGGGGGGGGYGGHGGPRRHRGQRGNAAQDQGFNASSQGQANGRAQQQQQTRDDGREVELQLGQDTAKPPLTAPVPQDTPRFAELAGSNLVHPSLISAITDDLKFDHMMPVQAATIQQLLPPNRRDCLVQAKTGTGKTVAFLLPALQTMIARGRGGSDSGISLLVISPTRELAMQIAEEATSLLQRLPKYRVCIAIGGSNKDREERQILGGCDVLVATPGRLFDHMSNEEIIYRFRHLDTLVLDEADRLLDMGFKKALQDIVGRLPDKKENDRQGMLFSATIAPHVTQVAGLVLSPGYEFITTIPPGEINTHQRVPQYLVTVPTFSSVTAALLGSLRKEAVQHRDFKAIIFAPTAALASFYGDILCQLPDMPPVSTLHSRISQNRRTKITNEYRDARAAILVATDVVARGMDFPGVTTVFQVGIPADKESYIHRLGRTARAGAEGRGIFIVCEAEAWFPKWTLKDIEFLPYEADLSPAAEVSRLAAAMEESERAKIYQAWLGYYNNHLKGLKWDKEELVRQANQYARDGLECPETPTIAKTTVGKMGLRGTRGLVVVPDPPKARHNRGPGGGKNGGGRGR